MPLLLTLAALHHGSVQLSGELSPEDLGFDLHDPCIEVRQPLEYELTAELMGDEILVQGTLVTALDCRCVRCLEPFELELRVDPWAAMLPLKGEDAVPVVAEAVDLTPQIREDSLIALPQHPVCRPECRGLPSPVPGSTVPGSSPEEKKRTPSAWSVLDKLKLD